jgi:hypothetical protein
MSREFIINAISASNGEYDKIAPQVPIILSVPSVIGLRERTEVYKAYTSKEGD